MQPIRGWVFRCVSTSIFNSLTHGLTLSSTWDSLTIPLLFEDMFTQYWKTHLHHVYRHVYIMFTDMFIPCLHHVYTIFEDISPPNLKICLHNVIGYRTCFWRQVLTMFEDVFTPCLHSFVHHVWIYVYTVFEDSFSQCWRTCVQYIWRQFFTFEFSLTFSNS